MAAASPYTLAWDTTTVTDGSVSITATATDADRNVGSSAAAAVTVANSAPAPAALAQLQTQIFTLICSVCHTGTGTALPGVQNLTAGNTFTNIVGVASIEQPDLLRIRPNDPAMSWPVAPATATDSTPPIVTTFWWVWPAMRCRACCA